VRLADTVARGEPVDALRDQLESMVGAEPLREVPIPPQAPSGFADGATAMNARTGEFVRVRQVADRFGEHDRGARRHFSVPRRDPRSRTAPHGDGLSTRTADPWRPQTWFGVDVARDETHFTLTAFQREFLERTEGGERVIVIPARRSTGWLEVFRMAEEMVRERTAPWWADAEACENGMGC